MSAVTEGMASQSLRGVLARVQQAAERANRSASQVGSPHLCPDRTWTGGPALA